KFPEDAAHDLGLGRVDAALAAHRLARGVVALHHIIAVAEAAAGLARLDAAAHAAPGLVREVLEEEAFMVPLRPTCRCVISPSGRVMIFTPANAMRLKTSATSSWSRLMRSRASASTTWKRSRRASASSAWMPVRMSEAPDTARS